MIDASPGLVQGERARPVALTNLEPRREGCVEKEEGIAQRRAQKAELYCGQAQVTAKSISSTRAGGLYARVIVRSQNPGADPPSLRCVRSGPKEVVISYSSPHKMCGVAKGIVRGIAKQLGEDVIVVESSCMLSGGATCEIAVHLAA